MRTTDPIAKNRPGFNTIVVITERLVNEWESFHQSNPGPSIEFPTPAELDQGDMTGSSMASSHAESAFPPHPEDESCGDESYRGGRIELGTPTTEMFRHEPSSIAGASTSVSPTAHRREDRERDVRANTIDSTSSRHKSQGGYKRPQIGRERSDSTSTYDSHRSYGPGSSRVAPQAQVGAVVPTSRRAFIIGSRGAGKVRWPGSFARPAHRLSPTIATVLANPCLGLSSQRLSPKDRKIR